MFSIGKNYTVIILSDNAILFSICKNTDLLPKKFSCYFLTKVVVKLISSVGLTDLVELTG